MTVLTKNYYNTSTITKSNIKSEFQSHLQIISASILQCKELSGVMPIQNDTSTASDTLVSSLVCDTNPRYSLDGGKGAFIPPAVNGFDQYSATENGDEFYIMTSVDLDSLNDDVLVELNSTYSQQQYELTINGAKRDLKFYLSR